jgi:hypothetical protein
MSTQALPYAHLGDAHATDYFQVRERSTSSPPVARSGWSRRRLTSPGGSSSGSSSSWRRILAGDEPTLRTPAVRN